MRIVLAMLGVHILDICTRNVTYIGNSPKMNMMYSPQTDPLLLSMRNRQIANISAARRDSKRGIPLGRRDY
eukprot:jgi/Antlo1/56/2331